jgi:hypothetical protein
LIERKSCASQSRYLSEILKCVRDEITEH